MTADVYAGDDDLNVSRQVSPTPARFRYEIEADSDPDALNRIANQLGFANRAPWALTLSTTDGCLTVDVELHDITEVLADYIRRKLLQQTCVIAVRLVVLT